MPIKIRAPRKKKALVEQVKNQYDHLKTSLRKRRGLVLSVISLLLLANGSFAAFLFFTRHTEKKAWTLESEASQLLHEDKAVSAKEEDAKKRLDQLAEAAKQYETIIKDYPSRQAVSVALYDVGHIYYELEKYDLAEAKYLELIKANASPALLPLAHLKLGYLYKKKNNTSAALDHFRQVYEGEGYLSQDQAGFESAKILEQTEKKSEAIEIYKKISTTYSESPWGMEAKARLTSLEKSTATSTVPLMDQLGSSAPTQLEKAAPIASSSAQAVPTTP